MSVREGENRVFANSSFDVSLAAPSAEASSRDSSRDGTGVEIVFGTGGGLGALALEDTPKVLDGGGSGATRLDEVAKVPAKRGFGVTQPDEAVGGLEEGPP